MKYKLATILIVLSGFIKGQNSIDWDGKYQLQFSDFQSTTTQIGHGNIYSLSSGANFNFSFHMSYLEFMFTKNFNSRVNCSFKRNAASLVAPDSSTALNLLEFARYDFDLSELYARKFRKKMFENKNAFSDMGFYKPIYDEIQTEFTERHTNASVQTDLGKNGEKLKELHEAVLVEIGQLSDFCKYCKPPKKRKK